MCKITDSFVFVAIIVIISLAVLYGSFLIYHLIIPNKECIMMKGDCPPNKYCGIDGKCAMGKEGERCFLGLAQCQRPYNCYPNFRCRKF